MTEHITLSETKNLLRVNHPKMRVSFRKSDGTWSLFDKYTGITKIDRAGFRLDGRWQHSWDAPPEKVSIKTKQVKTCFGDGITVSISRNPLKGYAPKTIQSLTFYDEHPFIELGWSVVNHRDYEIRVRDVDLLYGARLLPDLEIVDPKSLNGGAGATPNNVENGWEVDVFNSSMVTCRVDNQRHT